MTGTTVPLFFSAFLRGEVPAGLASTPEFYGVVVASGQQRAAEWALAMPTQLRANQGIT